MTAQTTDGTIPPVTDVAGDLESAAGEPVAGEPLADAAPPAGRRCFGDGDPVYERYHDTEWGVRPEPTVDERELLERLALEGFQSGLAWIIVLRKREAFRAAFADFAPDVVAGFGPDAVERLLADPGIVRNRRKIEATIRNAQALVALHAEGGRLWDVLERYRPEPRATPPASYAEVPTDTPESIALAKELKRLGFTFVGPVTTYATMQAVGLVDDHLATCPVRAA